jgi:ribulose-phosphate 3-epimerase
VSVICPTVTAYDEAAYRDQILRIKPFAKRVHIDLMDGEFAPTTSPPLRAVWWPHELTADIHLMYQRPGEYLDQLTRLRPHMVIVHNEAHLHHMHFAAELHRHGIKAGLAVLAETPIEWAEQIMHSFDQVLIFSGNLGHHGGEADLGLLEKVKFVRHHHPEVEIAWDGGINDQNARELERAGVDVLNVGGFVQNAADPREAYAKLYKVLEDKNDA